MPVSGNRTNRRRWVKDHPGQASVYFAILLAGILVVFAKMSESISWAKDLGILLPLGIVIGIVVARWRIGRMS